MEAIKVKYARDAYLPTLQQLVDFGEPVDVRGRKTQEILNYITEVEEPWHHCILLPSRRWNPWLAMSEALWILAGRNDVASVLPYNKNIVNFSDDGITLYGAYGARIYEQIDPLIERLRKDPSDRRCVLQIWDGRYYPDFLHPNDLITESKDPPCNNLVYFKLRDNKLHMTVINRSNDIHWGLYAVNLPTFGMLQEYIAARLDVYLGTQTHLSNSLHVYTDDKRAVEITDRMLYKEPEDKPEYPGHAKAFKSGDGFSSNKFKHKEMALMCNAVLDGEPYKYTWPGFFWYAGLFLKAYRERDLSLIPEDPRYTDWTLAAKLYADNVWK